MSDPCGNPDCDTCHPLPRWMVSQHRVQHITYERQIKAATPEEARRIFDEGTAWPSSYDDRHGEIVQLDDVQIVLVTDAHALAWHKRGHCYHRTTAKDMEEFLQRRGDAGDE